MLGEQRAERNRVDAVSVKAEDSKLLASLCRIDMGAFQRVRADSTLGEVTYVPSHSPAATIRLSSLVAMAERPIVFVAIFVMTSSSLLASCCNRIQPDNRKEPEQRLTRSASFHLTMYLSAPTVQAVEQSEATDMLMT